jgi:hypothetical protein
MINSLIVVDKWNISMVLMSIYYFWSVKHIFIGLAQVVRVLVLMPFPSGLRSESSRVYENNSLGPCSPSKPFFWQEWIYEVIIPWRGSLLLKKKKKKLWQTLFIIFDLSSLLKKCTQTLKNVNLGYTSFNFFFQFQLSDRIFS